MWSVVQLQNGWLHQMRCYEKFYTRARCEGFCWCHTALNQLTGSHCWRIWLAFADVCYENTNKTSRAKVKECFSVLTGFRRIQLTAFNWERKLFPREKLGEMSLNDFSLLNKQNIIIALPRKKNNKPIIKLHRNCLLAFFLNILNTSK